MCCCANEQDVLRQVASDPTKLARQLQASHEGEDAAGAVESTTSAVVRDKTIQQLEHEREAEHDEETALRNRVRERKARPYCIV